MLPMSLPVRQLDVREPRVIPIHQDVLRIAVLRRPRVVEAALLHRAPIYDNDLVVRKRVLEINANGDAGVREFKTENGIGSRKKTAKIQAYGCRPWAMPLRIALEPTRVGNIHVRKPSSPAAVTVILRARTPSICLHGRAGASFIYVSEERNLATESEYMELEHQLGFGCG